MPSRDIYQPVALATLRDGLKLRKEMKFYLDSERDRIDRELELAFRESLRSAPIGSSVVAETPGYWEKLVDACTTIGSRSLDRIEKRLQIIGHSLRWESGFDYRILAHQMYMATDQARKVKNAYMQRRKCVRAVLFNIDENETKDGRYRTALSTVEGDTPEFFGKWFEAAFSFFRTDSNVNSKFHETYSEEWFDFCDDFLSICISASPSKYENVFQNHYFKYIKQLESALARGPYRFGEPSARRNDIDLSENLALNLKLNAGELIMMYEFQKPVDIDIMALGTEIFFALMNKYHIEFLGVIPIQTGNKGIRIEFPKPDKPELLQSIQSTVMEIFVKYTN